jgi:hypothetical protein
LQNQKTSVDEFLTVIKKKLPKDEICILKEPGKNWRQATLPWRSKPLAVLSPADAQSIPALLKLASDHKVPIHPVARGRSWGLGSSLPPEDAVILDLSKLDRILDLDMQNGTARIEPGVTFKALQERLKQQGLAFHLPSFGARQMPACLPMLWSVVKVRVALVIGLQAFGILMLRLQQESAFAQDTVAIRLIVFQSSMRVQPDL